MPTTSSKVQKDSDKKTIEIGVVMPISASSDPHIPANHWTEVLKIIKESFVCVDEYDCKVDLVSNSDEMHIIQKTIVNNIYNKDIIICDVSTKNANVMFELGLRIAFDKPVVIIKDDETNYNFDTAPMEHLEYPRSLRHFKITEFQSKLKEKTLSSINCSGSYLKTFGDFEIKTIGSQELDIANAMEIFLERINDIDSKILYLSRRLPQPAARSGFRDNAIRQDYILSKARAYIRENPDYSKSELLEVLSKEFDTVSKKELYNILSRLLADTLPQEDYIRISEI